MNTYRNLAIICCALVVLFIVSLAYTMTLDKRINKQISEGFGIEFPAPPIPGEFSPYWSKDSILLKESDGPDRITVIYRTMGQVWELDYMTKHEYDSAFYNFLNYKP